MSNLLSIIMPYKDTEQWVSQTIESILGQASIDWELICVNDGSSDASQQIIDQIAQGDSRIKNINNLGVGIIPALQAGLLESNGRFITRMDSDDIMPVGRLSKMYRAIEASAPKTIVTGKVEYFSDEKVSQGYQKYQAWLNARVDKKDHWDHIYRECVIASPNWIVRKEDLIEHKIFKELKYPEDYDMVFRWKESGFSISCIDEVTLLWREHPERTSRNSDIYNQKSFFELKIEWFLKSTKNKKSLAILGAGPKGKLCAQLLNESNKVFTWHDFNHENYNTKIYDIEIEDYNDIKADNLLIAIYPESEEFDNFLKEKGYVLGRNAWYL